LLWVSSKDTVDRHNAAFRRIEELLGTNDNLKLPPTYGDMNRQELFLEGLRAGKITFEDGIDHNCDRFHNVNHIGVLGNSNPYGLTHTLFIPFVKLQGTDEQIAHWVPLAESGRIIGKAYLHTNLLSFAIGAKSLGAALRAVRQPKES
jgi:acyl-CoA oxidase